MGVRTSVRSSSKELRSPMNKRTPIPDDWLASSGERYGRGDGTSA